MKEFLFRSLRISALKSNLNEEDAEIRRDR